MIMCLFIIVTTQLGLGSYLSEQFNILKQRYFRINVRILKRVQSKFGVHCVCGYYAMAVYNNAFVWRM